MLYPIHHISDLTLIGLSVNSKDFVLVSLGVWGVASGINTELWVSTKTGYRKSLGYTINMDELHPLLLITTIFGVVNSGELVSVLLLLEVVLINLLIPRKEALRIQEKEGYSVIPFSIIFMAIGIIGLLKFGYENEYLVLRSMALYLTWLAFIFLLVLVFDWKYRNLSLDQKIGKFVMDSWTGIQLFHMVFLVKVLTENLTPMIGLLLGIVLLIIMWYEEDLSLYDCSHMTPKQWVLTRGLEVIRFLILGPFKYCVTILFIIPSIIMLGIFHSKFFFVVLNIYLLLTNYSEQYCKYIIKQMRENDMNPKEFRHLYLNPGLKETVAAVAKKFVPFVMAGISATTVIDYSVQTFNTSGFANRILASEDDLRNFNQKITDDYTSGKINFDEWSKALDKAEEKQQAKVDRALASAEIIKKGSYTYQAMDFAFNSAEYILKNLPKDKG
jgi:hypothetical protein